MEGANEATLPHEIGHFIRHKWLTGTELNRVERALGVRDGKWTRADEELFARIHENYLRTGLAPNKALKSVFQAFKAWMDKVYGDFRLEANDDVRRVLDKVYGRDRMDWRGLRKDLGGLRFRVTPNRKSGDRDKNQSVFLDDGQYSVTLTPGEMRQFLAAR